VERSPASVATQLGEKKCQSSPVITEGAILEGDCQKSSRMSWARKGDVQGMRAREEEISELLIPDVTKKKAGAKLSAGGQKKSERKDEQRLEPRFGRWMRSIDCG